MTTGVPHENLRYDIGEDFSPTVIELMIAIKVADAQRSCHVDQRMNADKPSSGSEARID